MVLRPASISIRAEQLMPCLPEGSPQGCSHGRAGCALWIMRAALCAVRPADHPGHQVDCLTTLNSCTSKTFQDILRILELECSAICLQRTTHWNPHLQCLMCARYSSGCMTIVQLALHHTSTPCSIPTAGQALLYAASQLLARCCSLCWCLSPRHCCTTSRARFWGYHVF